MNYYAKVKGIEETWQEVTDALVEHKETVCATLGPGAGYVCIAGAAIDGRPVVGKDGVTVSTYLVYKDQLKNAISLIVNDAARNTVRVAGDGTTTSTLLTTQLTLAVRKTIQKMKNDGVKVLTRAICKDLRFLLSESIRHLEEMVLEVDSKEILEKVALIACDGNKEIAEVVADAVWKVGKNGQVLIEDSADGNISMEYENGYVFGDKRTPTCFDQSFILDKKTGRTVLDNPYIVIADEELDTSDSLKRVVVAYQTLVSSNNKKGEETSPLLMIVSDCFGPAMQLIKNWCKSGYPIFVVKCPDFNQRREALLSDIAHITNTPRVFSKSTALIQERFGDGLMSEWEEFGRAKQVVFTKDNCIIKHDTSVESLVSDLEGAIENSHSAEDRAFYAERISKLVSGIASVYVGATTKTEEINARLSVDDTIRSCFCALRDGILPGAGVALKEVSRVIGNSKLSGLRYGDIISDFRKALEAPYVVIRENLETIVERTNDQLINELKGRLENIKKENFEDNSKNRELDLNILKEKIKVAEQSNEIVEEGFDSIINPITGVRTTALDAGIIDPLLVTKTALESAVSATTQLISIRKYIYSENAQ